MKLFFQMPKFKGALYLCTRSTPTAKTDGLLYQFAFHHNFQCQSSLSTQENDSVGRKSNLEKTHTSNSTFWETKPNWLHQFKSIDPKRKINEHFGVSPPGIVYSRNYDFRSVNMSVSVRSMSCKIPFNFTVDGCSAQAYFLNALAILFPSRCVP
jgi:hypothetical protein